MFEGGGYRIQRLTFGGKEGRVAPRGAVCGVWPGGQHNSSYRVHGERRSVPLPPERHHGPLRLVPQVGARSLLPLPQLWFDLFRHGYSSSDPSCSRVIRI